MIDFTSEEGIMDAIDKFFNLSQEEKDNYNKSLKVDKANILRFLYIFHEVFKLRDFGFNVENTTNELFKTGGVESTLCKATLCSCKEMIFDDKELTILSKSLKFCDKTNISLDFVEKTIIFNLIVNNAKTQEDLSYTDLVHYDAEVFDDDRSIFYDLREKTEVFYPDKDYDEQKLIDNIVESRKKGKKHHIIVNAEGIGHSEAMAKRIEAATGIETRATILGHMQRGGSPTCKDRVYASMMGALAVDLLVAGKRSRVVGYRHGEFVDFDINEALAMQKNVDSYMWEVCNSLSHNYNK